MPRKLSEITAHIRMVAANPSVSTTLIQTEDLVLLCDQAENPRMVVAALSAIERLEAGAPAKEVIALLEDALGV